MSKVYSYIRFSSARQASGDSLGRQTQRAHEWAIRHGHELDTEMTLHDLGVSGFDGANFLTGSLGQFITLAKTGKVEKDAILLVENLDRFSRSEIFSSMARFGELMDAGVRVGTINPDRIWDKKSVSEFGVIELIVEFLRAHGESKRKSDIAIINHRRNLEQARENGKTLIRRVPGWLLKTDYGYEPVPSKAETVRQIYQWRADGWGLQRIATELNTRNVETFGEKKNGPGGWHKTTVGKILKDAAAIGRCTPNKLRRENGRKIYEPLEPIDDFFPKIVPEALFYRVQSAPSASSGYRNKLVNLLSGIVHCKKCGSKMTLDTKVSHLKSGEHRTYHYLICEGRKRFKSCDAIMVPYQPVFETAAKLVMDKITFGAHMPDVEPLEHDLEAVQGKITEFESLVCELVDKIERTNSPALEKRLGEREDQLTTLKKERDELAARIAEGQDPGDPVEAYERFQEWYNTPVDDAEFESAMYASKAQIAAEIKKRIERIDVYRETKFSETEIDIKERTK